MCRVVVLLCAICVVLLAAPTSGAVKQGPLVVISPVVVDGQLVMHWIDDFIQGLQSDLESKYGIGGPPEGAGKPVTKSRWGADDPPKGANKPDVKSRYGSGAPPRGENKPDVKSKYGSGSPPEGAGKPVFD